MSPHWVAASKSPRLTRWLVSRTHQHVSVDVRLDDLLPLSSKPELLRLEHEVRVLSSRHLVIEDSRVGGPDVGLEAAVEGANGRPVEVESLDVLVTDSGTELGLLESGADGSHGGLRGHSRHGVDRDIDDIGTSGSAGEHTGGGDTSGVVRVNVDGHVGELLAQGTDEDGGSLGLQDTGHLSTERVSKLVRLADVGARLTSLMARTWIPQSTSSCANLR